jgi:hypothetical protein
VHFSGSPPSGFGSAANPFKNKADAKKNAAMEAVLWLRSQDQLAGAGSTKRRKSLASKHIPASESTELSPEATAQTGSI